MRIEIRQTNNTEKQMIELNSALKKLKKKLDKEGVFTTLKEKRYFIKPSETKHQKDMKLKHDKAKRKKDGKKK